MLPNIAVIFRVVCSILGLHKIDPFPKKTGDDFCFIKNKYIKKILVYAVTR